MERDFRLPHHARPPKMGGIIGRLRTILKILTAAQFAKLNFSLESDLCRMKEPVSDFTQLDVAR